MLRPWNSRGKPAVYLSQHESLAALEILAHTHPLLPADRYFAFQVEWPDELTQYLPANKLPAGWNARPPIPATRRMGDEWLEQMRSLVLAVPSLLSNSERNFLLNPRHRDFKKIRIGRPIEYRFDPRIVGR